MTRSHAFRPFSPEGLEDRLVMSHAAGGVLSAAEVGHMHLSRGEVRDILARQMVATFQNFGAALDSGLTTLGTTGNLSTFDAGLSQTGLDLTARITQILSSSPRASLSLVPYLQNLLAGSGVESLGSQLFSLPLTPSDPTSIAAFRNEAQALILGAQRASLHALGYFAENPHFDFSRLPAGSSQFMPLTPSTQTTPTTPTTTPPVTQPPVRVASTASGVSTVSTLGTAAEARPIVPVAPGDSGPLTPFGFGALAKRRGRFGL